MIHRKTAILLIIALCFSGLRIVENTEECKASVLPKFYVDDDYDSSTPGWGDDHFNSIQNAINSENCTSGDRIIVYSGTYSENVIINKSIDIFGEDREDTIINGGSSGNVITVQSSNVDISTFTIKSSGSNPKDAGIKVNTDNCNIVDNIIKNCKNGIFINSSNSNIISYNSLTSNSNAIFLESSCGSNTIAHNIIYSNTGEGIFLNSTCNSNTVSSNDIYSNSYNGIYLHDHCNQNTISGNNIYSNQKIGIRIENSSNNRINGNNSIRSNSYYGVLIVGSNNNVSNNIIKSNSKHGIFLLADDNTTVSNNKIKTNTYDGIRIQNSTDNQINGNIIKSNSRYGISINYYAVGNSIYNNYFASNTENNARDISAGHNSWSSTKTSGSNIINGPYIGGNYWDDYNGTDSDGDGIGNQSYTINGGSSQDNLPLMYRCPTADAGGLYTASTGEQIQFSGIDSTSPDGNITSYSWDFGDGDTGTGSTPYHIYTTAGTYTVTLTIVNTLGATDTDTTTATITDDTTAPTITVNEKGTTSSLSNLFTFSAYVTDNVGVNKVWIEYWYPGSIGKMTANMENTAGTLYKKVITAQGSPNRVYCVIYANDTSENTADTKNPVAEISGTYSDYQVLEEITFDGSESFDLDGNLTSYSWDFGDGTTGTGKTCTHTYFANDQYTVTLSVTDDQEKTDSDSIFITIDSLESISTSSTTLNTLQNWSETTLNESFYAYDTDGDGKMDTFSDPNEVLSTVQSNTVTINGNNSFLISVNNDLEKLYLWDAEGDQIINVTHQIASITEDTTDKTNDQILVKIQVNKAIWTYINVTDNYPDSEIKKIVRSSDNAQLSDNMIWRKNNKIYFLDDPSTVYTIYYDYNPPPIGKPEFTPPALSNIGKNNPTIRISYNVPVEIIDAMFYNYEGTRLYTKKDIKVIDNNKTFEYTPPNNLKDGTYQILIDVESIESGEYSEDIATYNYTSYTIPKKSYLPIYIMIVVILAGIGGAIFIIFKKKNITLESFIYFKNKKIIPFFKPLVFGPVRINVQEKNIKKAEFYVNGELKDTKTEPPYTWDFDEKGFIMPKIETKIYDSEGNTNSTGEMTFFVFNGPRLFR